MPTSAAVAGFAFVFLLADLPPLVFADCSRGFFVAFGSCACSAVAGAATAAAATDRSPFFFAGSTDLFCEPPAAPWLCDKWRVLLRSLGACTKTSVFLLGRTEPKSRCQQGKAKQLTSFCCFSTSSSTSGALSDVAAVARLVRFVTCRCSTSGALSEASSCLLRFPWTEHSEIFYTASNCHVADLLLSVDTTPAPDCSSAFSLPNSSPNAASWPPVSEPAASLHPQVAVSPPSHGTASLPRTPGAGSLALSAPGSLALPSPWAPAASLKPALNRAAWQQPDLCP